MRSPAPGEPDRQFALAPIGYVCSALTDPGRAPRQGRDAGTEARLEILERYRGALDGLASGAKIVVICWLHRADREALRVHPGRDPAAPLRGVFATRSPNRPNPLAVYTVDLLAVRDRTLYVRGVDAIDGTPVIDIRPHVPRLDE